jgi:hypothetical protein
MLTTAGIASDAGPPDAVPPTWILLFALLASATVGTLFLLAGRRWANRRRRGQASPPWRIWSISYTVPHHPEDGYFFGAILLGLAVLAFGGLVARLLNLW